MSLKVLVLGGTQMLGRDFVDTISRVDSYNITLANRGITNPSLFPNINHITIDRNDSSKCATLSGQSYDYVVDFSCYNPDQLNNTLQYLEYNRYILISTVSVLEVDRLNQSNAQDQYYQYCLLKKQVEDLIINNNSISNITIVRPPAVYGEHDYTNRFEKRGGEDFFWKSSNNAKACKETGCIAVSEVTSKLLEIMQTDQNERVYICNLN